MCERRFWPGHSGSTHTGEILKETHHQIKFLKTQSKWANRHFSVLGVAHNEIFFVSRVATGHGHVTELSFLLQDLCQSDLEGVLAMWESSDVYCVLKCFEISIWTCLSLLSINFECSTMFSMRGAMLAIAARNRTLFSIYLSSSDCPQTFHQFHACFFLVFLSLANRSLSLLTCDPYDTRLMIVDDRWMEWNLLADKVIHGNLPCLTNAVSTISCLQVAKCMVKTGENSIPVCAWSFHLPTETTQTATVFDLL